MHLCVYMKITNCHTEIREKHPNKKDAASTRNIECLRGLLINAAGINNDNVCRNGNYWANLIFYAALHRRVQLDNL